MIIKIENITAHPFKEFDLFCEQLEQREEDIKNILEEYETFKMVFLNDDYVIVSPSFKNKDNEKYQRTYFTVDNEPLSHTTFKDVKDILKDSYTRHYIKHIEV